MVPENFNEFLDTTFVICEKLNARNEQMANLLLKLENEVCNPQSPEVRKLADSIWVTHTSSRRLLTSLFLLLNEYSLPF